MTELVNKSTTTDLYDALLILESREEAINFLRDLCTPREISELSERWKVCQLLASGEMSYREIYSATKASITTIGRVARFLRDEQNNGYRAVLYKLKSKNGN
jgi:TrpR-related protein YerC/YecD